MLKYRNNPPKLPMELRQLGDWKGVDDGAQ